MAVRYVGVADSGIWQGAADRAESGSVALRVAESIYDSKPELIHG